MAFTLPDLPYAHDALASNGMSRETMEYHHDKHHNAYVTKGNELVEKTQYAGADNSKLEEIIPAIYGKPEHEGLFNQLSQHWNHIQFWQMMGPGSSAMPSELEKRITDAFGSVDKFKEAFSSTSSAVFGSGWGWLVVDNGELKVVKTPNGVNPLCFGQHALLGVDMWEHSFYIDHRNNKGAYLKGFLDNLVNWENVAERLARAGG